MSNFRPLSCILLCAAGLLRGQTTPAAAPDHDKIVNLDELIVSAGVDGKTAFDLAQGSSILAGEELRRRTALTLGETLAALPGVTATSFGPGASRPIIRGLGGDRVRVLGNGVGALDASTISPDHGVALEPLFASRIEVLRGPAALLYGSSAVGGVVNVIDQRIPEDAGDGSPHGAIELRGFGASRERTAVAAVGGGNDSLAVQVDALRRRTEDLRIPGVARIDADAPEDQPAGILPHSATDTRDGSIGVTSFGPAGKIGFALQHYATRYGVPVGEAEPITIDLRQTRLDLAAETSGPVGIFRAAKLRAGFGRYRHDELDGEAIGTTFRNRAWESRLELPFGTSGSSGGTLGAQLSGSDFSAVGDEVSTPPSRSQSAAVFALEEFPRGKVTWQGGVRLEHARVRLGDVPDDLPEIPGYAAKSGGTRSFLGASGSVGMVFHPDAGTSLACAVAYTERAPTAQELFSNGPHGGTAAYEIGTGDLAPEKSLGFDVSYRRRTGFATTAVGLFVNRFNGYIFEQELAADAVPESANPEGLTPYQFVARDALFCGGEAELTLHLLEREDASLHFALTADYVRARQTADDENLPRISPFRVGARLSGERGRWRAGIDLRRTEAQRRNAPGETPTAGYTLLGIDVATTLVKGLRPVECFLRGDNLTDTEARPATSFLKELAPLAGRSVSAGLRAAF